MNNEEKYEITQIFDTGGLDADWEKISKILEPEELQVLLCEAGERKVTKTTKAFFKKIEKIKEDNYNNNTTYAITAKQLKELAAIIKEATEAKRKEFAEMMQKKYPKKTAKEQAGAEEAAKIQALEEIGEWN